MKKWTCGFKRKYSNIQEPQVFQNLWAKLTNPEWDPSCFELEWWTSFWLKAAKVEDMDFWRLKDHKPMIHLKVPYFED